MSQFIPEHIICFGDCISKFDGHQSNINLDAVMLHILVQQLLS